MRYSIECNDLSTDQLINLIQINQHDFDEAFKKLPSVSNYLNDVYIVPLIHKKVNFVFRKTSCYVIPPFSVLEDPIISERKLIKLEQWTIKSIELI